MLRFSALIGLLTLSLGTISRADDWPQYLGPQRDSIWRESGIVEKLPAKLTPRWQADIEGGYSGPAVAMGKVYLFDYSRKAGDNSPAPDKRNQLQGSERVLCFDEATGKSLWKHEYVCPYKISYPAGPRCTPTVDGERVYTLGAEGNLTCLNANSGEVVWSHELKKDYKVEAPLWGFCSHPLVDGNKLICLVGGDGSTCVAFDKVTGKELWKGLTAKEPGYGPTVIIEAGGARQLIAWHSQAINGLDPETGKVYWSIPLEPLYGMSIMQPTKAGNFLFAGGIGERSALLKLASDRPAAEVVYRGEKKGSLYPVNTTPIVDGDMMYGVDQNGSLCGVRISDAKRLWETPKPTSGKTGRNNSATAFLVKNGDRYFIFAETGDLIIAKLSEKGYDELSRAKLIEATGAAWGRQIVWSHPAFANKCVFARNDKQLVCVSLAAE